MSPRKQRARKVPADPDRWPPCVRCGQAYRDASPWPEGRVCCYCTRAARQREGTCARCGHHGVVPGLIDGQPACVQCSGVPVDVHCRRCGQEAPMGFAITCWRCQLQAQLTGLLADPDGVILPALQPFVDALLGLPQPRIAYVWIRRNAAVQTTLRRLGTGEVSARPRHLRPDARTDHRVPPRAARRTRLPAWPGPLPRHVRVLATDQARPDHRSQRASPHRRVRSLASASSAPRPGQAGTHPRRGIPQRQAVHHRRDRLPRPGWPAAAANWRPSPRPMWTPGTRAGPAPDTTPPGSSAGHANNTSSGSISRGSSTTAGRS